MAKNKQKKTAQHTKPVQPIVTEQKGTGRTSIDLSKALWGVFIIYMIAVLYGISNHEPWRDEAQSWLIVKNLDIVGLFKKLPSEGHPPMWYLCLFPLAKLGLPYAAQNILCALLMIAGVYVLLFKTRLHIAIKLLLPFSYLFLFEYSVIGRNYCLLVFFISLILWLYPQRFNRPYLFAFCVAALANTHTLIMSFSFSLSCIFFLDAVKQKRLNGRTMGAFIFMTVAILYIIPYLASAKLGNAFSPYVSADVMWRALSLGLIATDNKEIVMLLLALLCLSFIGRTKPFLLMLGGLVSVLYILGYVFPGDVRHGGVVFLIAIAVSGLYGYYEDDEWNLIATRKWSFLKYNYIVPVIIILAQIKPAFENYMLDKDTLFSDARNAAEYIKDHKLQDRIIIGEQAWAASALLPYLRDHKEFFYVECGRYGSYYVFDTCFTNGHWGQAPETYVNQAAITFPDKKDQLLFVFNSPLPPTMAGSLDLLYATQNPTIKSDESYYIYQFRMK